MEVKTRWLALLLAICLLILCGCGRKVNKEEGQTGDQATAETVQEAQEARTGSDPAEEITISAENPTEKVEETAEETEKPAGNSESRVRRNSALSRKRAQRRRRSRKQAKSPNRPRSPNRSKNRLSPGTKRQKLQKRRQRLLLPKRSRRARRRSKRQNRKPRNPGVSEASRLRCRRNMPTCATGSEKSHGTRTTRRPTA